MPTPTRSHQRAPIRSPPNTSPPSSSSVSGNRPARAVLRHLGEPVPRPDPISSRSGHWCGSSKAGSAATTGRPLRCRRGVVAADQLVEIPARNRVNWHVRAAHVGLSGCEANLRCGERRAIGIVITRVVVVRGANERWRPCPSAVSRSDERRRPGTESRYAWWAASTSTRDPLQQTRSATDQRCSSPTQSRCHSRSSLTRQGGPSGWSSLSSACLAPIRAAVAMSVTATICEACVVSGETAPPRATDAPADEMITVRGGPADA